MKAPAWTSARRPKSSCAFHIGQAWIINGQISRMTGTVVQRGCGETRGIVEQRLGRSDLDQCWRQAPQVGIERRNACVLPVGARRETGLGQLLQIVLVDERILGVLGKHRRARHGEIGPR